MSSLMNSQAPSATDLPEKVPTPEAGAWRYNGILELLSKVVLLGGPVFYVLGRIYAQGYWTAFGLPSSALGVDAEDYIFFGFVVIANSAQLVVPLNSIPFWAPALGALISLPVLALLVLIFRWIEIWLGKRLKSSVLRFREKVADKSLVRDSLQKAAGMMIAAGSVLLAFLIAWTALLLPVLIASSLGKKQADEAIREIKAGKGPYQEVQVDGKPAGRVIECPNEYCVIAKNDSFALIRLEDVQWIKH